jgi:hypothetical protein
MGFIKFVLRFMAWTSFPATIMVILRLLDTKQFDWYGAVYMTAPLMVVGTVATAGLGIIAAIEDLKRAQSKVAIVPTSATPATTMLVDSPAKT